MPQFEGSPSENCHDVDVHLIIVYHTVTLWLKFCTEKIYLVMETILSWQRNVLCRLYANYAGDRRGRTYERTVALDW